mmetsp:Transcript_10205/g.30148  ORF Transcript_10205/g.30148 Transcript_10205/m.30148 type:complete len:405 (-) Transcript_10205:157-1371(-)
MLVPRSTISLLSLLANPAFAFIQPPPFSPTRSISRPSLVEHSRRSPRMAGEAAGAAPGGGTVVEEVLAPSGGSDLNHVAGLRDVAPSHAAFLLDMWGVMHDGSKPYNGALESVRRLKEDGKKMVILSNSSKRIGNSHKMLRKLGFDPDDFDGIITSGEVSYRMLAGDSSLECSTWSVLDDLLASDRRKVLVFGSGDGDEEYCNSAGWELTSADEADLIVARGTFTVNDGSGSVASKTEDEEAYFRSLEAALETAARRGVPMLVTNPDRVRPDEGLPPMPGAIGDSYEAALAAAGVAEDPSALVRRIGKPFAEVYELAFGHIGGIDGGVCMVGDALETDVTGGSQASCSTLWVVENGIHAPAVAEVCGESYERGASEVLDRFNEERGLTDRETLRPTFVMPSFRW